MSHDTDKLIRQLSLVAFLMAERRPLTARDVKGNVEGYSEMSDEAFARRFYSDRAELIQLGVPLHSQRDEFTGEELYTLKSDQYFLNELQLDDDELAALQTALFLLEGEFAYSEPLRLALQNLALGRPGPLDNPTPGGVRVDMRDPDYSVEMSGRLTKLENAISKQRTIKFRYWTISRDREGERTVNPYALLNERGSWYLIGRDLDKDDVRTYRVSRIRGDIRFATRRERDFRAPEDFEITGYRGREPWQFGDIQATAEIDLDPDTAWWVERTIERGEIEDGVFRTEYADLGQIAAWVLRQDGRARPLAPKELVDEVKRGLEAVAEAHAGDAPQPARESRRRTGGEPAERPVGPVAPERFAVLQALLAYLLARCGDETSVVIPAEELSDRFHLTGDALAEHLALLNLVNFGGGCYAVYANVSGNEVHVQKELFGDAFRRAPRLTPLEARAIRLALEFVGPMIAASAHTPLDRVRRKLEETFGQFGEPDESEPEEPSEEEQTLRTLSQAIEGQRLVEIEYLAVGEEPTTRTIEPHTFERELPWWYVHSWDRSRDAQRSFRLDRIRSVTLLDEQFEQRPDLVPEKLRQVETARVLFTKPEAQRRIERSGARQLTDGTALEEMRHGSEEWLVSEILSYRGEAIVLEPTAIRRTVAARAKALRKELFRRRSSAPA
jgi:predicted DNA-binding transcriptional regulator YafY